jgi:hypothetical protein
VADVGPLTTDQRKPAVSIFIVQPVPDEMIEHVLWGLEEEGIPYEIVTLESGVAEVMAKQAADGSQLNVGIGINCAEEKAVLHHHDLPEEKPLFSVGLKDARALVRLRILGGNAARLVKGEPLIFSDEPLLNARARSSLDSSSTEPDDLVKIITKLVMELLDNK